MRSNAWAVRKISKYMATAHTAFLCAIQLSDEHWPGRTQLDRGEYCDSTRIDPAGEDVANRPAEIAAPAPRFLVFLVIYESFPR